MIEDGDGHCVSQLGLGLEGKARQGPEGRHSGEAPFRRQPPVSPVCPPVGWQQALSSQARPQSSFSALAASQGQFCLGSVFRLSTVFSTRQGHMSLFPPRLGWPCSPPAPTSGVPCPELGGVVEAVAALKTTASASRERLGSPPAS